MQSESRIIWKGQVKLQEMPTDTGLTSVTGKNRRKKNVDLPSYSNVTHVKSGK